MRQYSFIDRICFYVDQSVKTLNGLSDNTGAPYPGNLKSSTTLSSAESKQSASLMRVNHAGEICAQGLYHGQAAGSCSTLVANKMQHAAIEEGDHLIWCENRLKELNSHTSYLNPLWYTGSFMMGYAAGKLGDDWSLGFVAETEKQVLAHLE